MSFLLSRWFLSFWVIWWFVERQLIKLDCLWRGTSVSRHWLSSAKRSQVFVWMKLSMAGMRCGLLGVLSVTEGFNFSLPIFASSFICRAAEVPSLSLCSIYMDHREQDHNSSSFYRHAVFLLPNRLGCSSHNFVFHGFPCRQSETSSKFLLLIRGKVVHT